MLQNIRVEIKSDDTTITYRGLDMMYIYSLLMLTSMNIVHVVHYNHFLDNNKMKSVFFMSFMFSS